MRPTITVVRTTFHLPPRPLLGLTSVGGKELSDAQFSDVRRCSALTDFFLHSPQIRHFDRSGGSTVAEWKTCGSAYSLRFEPGGFLLKCRFLHFGFAFGRNDKSVGVRRKNRSTACFDKLQLTRSVWQRLNSTAIRSKPLAYNARQRTLL